MSWPSNNGIQSFGASKFEKVGIFMCPHVLFLQARSQLKKCQFAQKSVTYLGHIISDKGIKPDKVKLEAVSNYPTPTSSK